MKDLERIGEGVRAAQDDEDAEARDLRAARRVVLSASRSREHGPVGRRLVGLVAVLALAVVAVARLGGSAEGALRYRVGAGASDDRAGEIRADEVPTDVTFSDGSELRLAPGGSLWLDAIDARGATVNVRGSVRARVRHGERTSWAFRAGPYLVRVIGTAFELGWDGEAMDLALEEGRVSVTGPGIEPRIVSAGERVHLRSGGLADAVEDGPSSLRGTALAAPLVPEPPSETGMHQADTRQAAATETGTDETGTHATGTHATGTDETGTDETGTDETGTDETGTHATGTDETGTQRGPSETGTGDAVARRTPDEPGLEPGPARELAVSLQHASAREHAEAMRAISDDGFAHVLRTASAEDLLSLGDSARLAHDLRRARSALLSVRGRFPGTASAARAAYMLGRLATDQGDARTATLHFQRYLDEAPRGALAREALGNLIQARVAMGADASGEARRYLADYPDGPHAELARQVADE